MSPSSNPRYFHTGSPQTQKQMREDTKHLIVEGGERKALLMERPVSAQRVRSREARSPPLTFSRRGSVSPMFRRQSFQGGRGLVLTITQLHEAPWWLSGEEPACSAGDTGLTPGSGRSPGGENGTCSSTLTWRIPRTEEAGGPQSKEGGGRSWTRLIISWTRLICCTHTYPSRDLEGLWRSVRKAEGHLQSDPGPR